MPQTAFLAITRTLSTAAQSLTDLGLTQAQVNQATKATVTAGANPIRYLLSGETPTATFGHYVAANGTEEIEGREDIYHLKLIAVGGDSLITVSLHRGEYS
jgi:hypothetical protein